MIRQRKISECKKKNRENIYRWFLYKIKVPPPHNFPPVCVCLWVAVFPPAIEGTFPCAEA